MPSHGNAGLGAQFLDRHAKAFMQVNLRSHQPAPRVMKRLHFRAVHGALPGLGNRHSPLIQQHASGQRPVGGFQAEEQHWERRLIELVIVRASHARAHIQRGLTRQHRFTTRGPGSDDKQACLQAHGHAVQIRKTQCHARGDMPAIAKRRINLIHHIRHPFTDVDRAPAAALLMQIEQITLRLFHGGLPWHRRVMRGGGNGPRRLDHHPPSPHGFQGAQFALDQIATLRQRLAKHFSDLCRAAHLVQLSAQA